MLTVDYKQIVNGNIHGFTIDYGKFILKMHSIHPSHFQKNVIGKIGAN